MDAPDPHDRGHTERQAGLGDRRDGLGVEQGVLEVDAHEVVPAGPGDPGDLARSAHPHGEPEGDVAGAQPVEDGIAEISH